MRPSEAPAGAARRPGSSRGRASRLAGRRRSAGSMNTQKQTIVDSGLPGQPEDERVAAAAEPQRLAGLDPHAPEDLLDAARLERGLDVVVRADRDAAGDDQHVALQARRDGASRVASRSSPITPWSTTSAPARSASSRTISPLDSWIRPGSGGAPSGSSSLPVTIRCRRGRRWTATSPTPAEASAEMRGSVSRVARRARARRPRAGPRRGSGRACPASARRSGATRAVAPRAPARTAGSRRRPAGSPRRSRSRAAVPGSSAVAATSPAATSPTSRSATPGAVSAARTA